jgi:two-component system invasion response regulator UvrY
MKKMNILLVDDHELFRSGIKSILENKDDFMVVEEAASGEEAIDKIREQLPDLVLMDVNMPGIGGMEATRRLQRMHPDLPVIAVTVLNDDPFPSKMLDAGARGFLTKTDPADELFVAINAVMQGNYHISTHIAQKLALSGFVGKTEASPLAKLSPREMQTMVMIAQGKKTGEIADIMCLSPKTISTFRSRLFEKMGVINDVELTHVALRYNLVDPL